MDNLPQSDEPYIELIRRLIIPDHHLLAGAVDHVEIVLTPECYSQYVTSNEQKNLYILGGITPEIGLARASDEHVRKKNYFVIDVDVRELWKKKGDEIADAEIKELGEWFAGALKDHTFLKDWSYIIFSGNGIHLWYIGESVAVESTEHWKAGMKHLLKEFQAHTKMEPDFSCINVSKLFRLPGSFNNKNGAHTKVEILCTQPCNIAIAQVEKIGEEKFRKAQEEIRERAAQIKLEYPDGDSAYQAIQKIPVVQLVSRVFGWDTDGRNFWDAGTNGKKFKACYVPDGTNFLYHGGTEHLPADHEGYSPFELVKVKEGLDNAQTFNWFKVQFPEIAEISNKEARKKGKRRKKREEEEEEEMEEAPKEPETPIDLSQFQPMTSQDVIRILGLTVKKDEENKLVTFLSEISAYTENDQANLIFNAPSSTGKSYIPTEIALLFPEQDVVEIGYCSPQAFFHDYGKFDKERKAHIIDLSRKIVIFLDQPHVTLLERLRPLLSHDKKEIKVKIADRSQKHGMRTKNIILRGFPSVIFCTAGLKMDEQEATRFFLLSPQMDQEKIRQSIQEKVRRSCDRDAYTSWLDQQPERKLLKERIRAIRQTHLDEVKIPNHEAIADLFLKPRAILKPRHQRDIGRLLSLIKSFAILNFMFRQRQGNTILAEQSDIDEAVKIWDKISESQEHNISPFVFDIFKNVILPAFAEKNAEQESDSLIGEDPTPQGLSVNDILKKHMKVYGRMIASWVLRQQVLPMLEVAGLITEEADPNDKRRNVYFPFESTPPEKNSE